MDNPYLYEFSATGPGFIRIETASPPPRLSESAFTADPSGRLLYLFGGFDGAGYHNWLWTLDLGDRSWSMTAPDCLSGPCPYISAAPVFYGNASAGHFVALPGHGALSGSPAHSQEYFLFDLDSREWAPASQRSGIASAAGDCDGDGEPEPGHASLCRIFQNWWNVPGRMMCDTMTSSLVCMQPAGSLAAQHGMNRSGAVDIDAVENALFMAKGNRVHVFDMSAPEAPVEVTSLKLKQKVKDLEQDQGILAAAAGDRIVLIDVSSPFSPLILSDTPSCGNVTGLEVSESRVTFLTNIGLGILNIGNPSAPSLAGFASLLKEEDGSWTAVDFFTGCGNGFLPASPMIPFDAGDGMAFIGAASGLLIVRLGDAGYEVASFLGLTSSIDELKHDRGSVYLNLHDGSRITVDVSPAGEAVVSGTHDLEDWVRGIVPGDGKVYRLTGNQIQTAVLR